METKKTVGLNYVEWHCLPVSNQAKNQQHPQLKQKPDQKDKEREMIRELQAVFCKGRYRSWILN
ncbi:hypothetical protein R84B8_01649 [Treponema sp. R8-4-B8]